MYAGVIRRESWTTYDKMNVASGIQDFLICIEMFLAALAHAYAFPPRVGGVSEKGGRAGSLARAFVLLLSWPSAPL